MMMSLQLEDCRNHFSASRHKSRTSPDSPHVTVEGLRNNKQIRRRIRLEHQQTIVVDASLARAGLLVTVQTDWLLHTLARKKAHRPSRHPSPSRTKWKPSPHPDDGREPGGRRPRRYTPPVPTTLLISRANYTEQTFISILVWEARDASATTIYIQPVGSRLSMFSIC